MSVEDRLRAGLAANAAQGVDPDVEQLLLQVLERGRWRRGRRWAAVATGVAVACTAVALAVAARWGADDGPPRPATTPSVHVSPGRYAGLVPALPGAPDASGRWTLDFDARGGLTVTAPPGYTRDRAGTQGEIDGDRLRTTLFQHDLCLGQPAGTYTVERLAEHLTLTRLQDPCAARSTLLGATSWLSTGASTYTGPTIPDGRWARDITTVQARAQGFRASPEWLAANGLTDGRSRLYLDFRRARWTVVVEDDGGSPAVGDQGPVVYDALGRWVQAGSLAIEWSVAGDTLTTRNVVRVDGRPAEPDERFVLEGVWTRVPGR